MAKKKKRKNTRSLKKIKNVKELDVKIATQNNSTKKSKETSPSLHEPHDLGTVTEQQGVITGSIIGVKSGQIDLDPNEPLKVSFSGEGFSIQVDSNAAAVDSPYVYEDKSLKQNSFKPISSEEKTPIPRFKSQQMDAVAPKEENEEISPVPGVDEVSIKPGTGNKGSSIKILAPKSPSATSGKTKKKKSKKSQKIVGGPSIEAESHVEEDEISKDNVSSDISTKVNEKKSLINDKTHVPSQSKSSIKPEMIESETNEKEIVADKTIEPQSSGGPDKTVELKGNGIPVADKSSGLERIVSGELSINTTEGNSDAKPVTGSKTAPLAILDPSEEKIQDNSEIEAMLEADRKKREALRAEFKKNMKNMPSPFSMVSRVHSKKNVSPTAYSSYEPQKEKSTDGNHVPFSSGTISGGSIDMRESEDFHISDSKSSIEVSGEYQELIKSELESDLVHKKDKIRNFKAVDSTTIKEEPISNKNKVDINAPVKAKKGKGKKAGNKSDAPLPPPPAEVEDKKAILKTTKDTPDLPPPPPAEVEDKKAIPKTTEDNSDLPPPPAEVEDKKAIPKTTEDNSDLPPPPPAEVKDATNSGQPVTGTLDVSNSTNSNDKSDSSSSGTIEIKNDDEIVENRENSGYIHNMVEDSKIPHKGFSDLEKEFFETEIKPENDYSGLDVIFDQMSNDNTKENKGFLKSIKNLFVSDGSTRTANGRKSTGKPVNRRRQPGRKVGSNTSVPAKEVPDDIVSATPTTPPPPETPSPPPETEAPAPPTKKATPVSSSSKPTSQRARRQSKRKKKKSSGHRKRRR